jgi:hypothetical protein
MKVFFLYCEYAVRHFRLKHGLHERNIGMLSTLHLVTFGGIKWRLVLIKNARMREFGNTCPRIPLSCMHRESHTWAKTHVSKDSSIMHASGIPYLGKNTRVLTSIHHPHRNSPERMRATRPDACKALQLHASAASSPSGSTQNNDLLTVYSPFAALQRRLDRYWSWDDQNIGTVSSIKLSLILRR